MRNTANKKKINGKNRLRKMNERSHGD